MRFMMLVIPKGYETAQPDQMPDAGADEECIAARAVVTEGGGVSAVDELHFIGVEIEHVVAEGKDDHPFADLDVRAIDLLVVLVGDDRTVGEINLVCRAVDRLDRDFILLDVHDRADNLEFFVGARRGDGGGECNGDQPATHVTTIIPES